MAKICQIMNNSAGDCLIATTFTTDYDHVTPDLPQTFKVKTQGSRAKGQGIKVLASKIVSGTTKFDRGVSRLLHTELHWLDVPQRVAYKLSVMMFSCMHGQAPQYLIDFCHPTSSVASRQYLRSACRHSLSFHAAG